MDSLVRFSSNLLKCMLLTLIVERLLIHRSPPEAKSSLLSQKMISIYNPLHQPSALMRCNTSNQSTKIGLRLYRLLALLSPKDG